MCIGFWGMKVEYVGLPPPWRSCFPPFPSPISPRVAFDYLFQERAWMDASHIRRVKPLIIVLPRLCVALRREATWSTEERRVQRSEPWLSAEYRNELRAKAAFAVLFVWQPEVLSVRVRLTREEMGQWWLPCPSHDVLVRILSIMR